MSDGSGSRPAAYAAFLRARRHALRPGDVGLPDGLRRRTPGLRRQEVAELAGVSVDYYIRLEQGRGAHPSRQILAALARALLLSRDERDYLFRVAGESPPAVAGPDRELTSAVRYLLDSLTETPAYVIDAKYDVLAWNRLATVFIGDLAGYPPHDRNALRWMFRQPADAIQWSDPDTQRYARGSVADLRAAYARYPADPGIGRLVSELLELSPRFAEMWASHEVETRRRMLKRVSHPEHGPLEFECQVLLVPDADQRLIVYCPAPGSHTEATFRRLARAVSAAPAADDPTPTRTYGR